MWTPILALALAAQISAIQGEVRDAQSHAVVPFARVTLSSARTTVDWRYTDQNGRFHFAGLPDATYYVLSVDHTSYNSVELDGSSLLAALPSLVQMELVPRQKRPSGSGSAVSASELSIPKDARKELDRARNYVRHGRSDLAEKSYLKAAALSDAPEISVNFADLYAGQQRYREAETLLVEAIRRHSNAGDLYHALATIYFALGRDDDAAELARQAHVRKHGIADVHLLLAKIQLKRQDFEGVVDQLEIYLREAPVGPNSPRIRQDLAKYRNRP